MSEILARLIESPVGPRFAFGDYRVARASTRAEEAEVFAFRHHCFLTAGFIERSTFPNGILRDDFDKVATQISVRDSLGNLVGVTRFVHNSVLGFHTETLFEFEFPPIPRERLAEFGRLAILSDHRGGDRIVMLAMLKAVFECMVESGTTHVLAFLSQTLADSFSRIGCKCLTLRTRTPSHRCLRNRKAMQPYFEGQSPTPVLYDLEEMLNEVGVNRRSVSTR